MGMEDHITGRIADVCARMGDGVVEEPEDFIIGLLGGLGFLGGDRAEGGKYGRVNGNGVVQQGPDDMLDEGDGVGWQDRRFVGVVSPLVVPAGAAPFLWLQKIGGVAMGMEDHI